MARPIKETVDYFPHYVKNGRTIFILENRFGNTGYAFWFKVLEILGESEGHYYECANASNWEFLLAKTHTDEDTAKDIIAVLIDLGKIDADLWREKRVLWIGNFVRNLSSVYRMRHIDVPEKPCLTVENITGVKVLPDENPKGKELSAQETDKEKESKEKKRKEKDSIEYPYADIVRLWNEICGGVLPRVAKLTDARRQKIKVRLSESGAKTTQGMVAWAQDLFTLCRGSRFLCGENKNDWTATFDWVFENEKNWVKVSEGNYANDRGAKKQRTGVQNNLGVGEYLTEDGRRTYGTGKANIPLSAPPRPSERYSWDEQSKSWILL